MCLMLPLSILRGSGPVTLTLSRHRCWSWRLLRRRRAAQTGAGSYPTTAWAPPASTYSLTFPLVLRAQRSSPLMISDRIMWPPPRPPSNWRSGEGLSAWTSPPLTEPARSPARKEPAGIRGPGHRHGQSSRHRGIPSGMAPASTGWGSRSGRGSQRDDRSGCQYALARASGRMRVGDRHDDGGKYGRHEGPGMGTIRPRWGAGVPSDYRAGGAGYRGGNSAEQGPRRGDGRLLRCASGRPFPQCHSRGAWRVRPLPLVPGQPLPGHPPSPGRRQYPRRRHI